MLQDAGMAINPTNRRGQAQACLTTHAVCPEPASFIAPIDSSITLPADPLAMPQMTSISHGTIGMQKFLHPSLP